MAIHGLIRGRLGLGPGHQGAIWLALLVVGRGTSRLPWAGVTSAIGAGATAMLPFWGFGDPFRWLAYLVGGTALDFSWLASKTGRRRLWLLIPLGGLAHATKPVLRAWVTSTTGWPYESLLTGLAYPIASHAAFGMIGAAVGVAFVTRWARRGGSAISSGRG